MLAEVAAGMAQSARACMAVLPPMLLGCLAGSFFSNSRLGARCSALFTPLARIAGLEGAGALYPILCFLNFNSANAYLASLIRTGRVHEKKLTGTYLTGMLPANCHYLLFFYAPILIPGLGLETALPVLGLFFAVSVMVFATGAALLRKKGARLPQAAGETGPEPATAWPAWPGLKTVVSEGIRQFLRIAMVFVPSIFAVQIFLNLPPARALMDLAGKFLAWIEAPSAAVLVIMTALPSIMAGFASAISCLQDSLITLGQIPVILLAASLAHSAFSAFFGTLAVNASIFGPRPGARVTFVCLGVRGFWVLGAMVVAGFI